MRHYDFVHDPSLIKADHRFYAFSTGDPAGKIGNGNIQIRSSSNLKNWHYDGTVFSKIPSWVTDKLGSIPNLWAPAVSYFNGKYHLYYAGSSFGSNHSVIGLATNKTLNPADPNYKWQDQGLVFQSTSNDNYNAIDPSIIKDHSGKLWMSFGSFWSGIKLVQLNPKTGMLKNDSGKIYALAQRQFPDAIEGSAITYHDSFYYLFVSFGFCCRGTGSTYRIMMGRSKQVTGPYVDPTGKSMMKGGGMELLGSAENMIGPGSASIFKDGDRYYIGYHYYDAADNGDAKLGIRRLYWTKDGWPYTGEQVVRSK